MFHCDFETRSKVDVRKVGAAAYSEHPSTEILRLTFHRVGHKAVYLWRKGDPYPTTIFDLLAEDESEPVGAHNAYFERCIWKNICVARMGWQPIPLRRWRCTAAKAASHALPRALAEAGKALKLAVVKDEAGKKTMLKMSKPRKATKNDQSEWHDSAADNVILDNYNIQDVLAETALDEALPDLRPDEQELWFLDQEINDTGITVDIEAVRGAIKVLKEHSDNLIEELVFLTDGEIQTPKQTAKLKDWLNTNFDLGLGSVDKAAIETALDMPHLDPDARRVLEIRQSLARASTAKYEAMLRSVCRDGRLKDLLMFHGAATGRWSGKGVQLHNLPKGYFKDMSECAIDFRSGNLAYIKAMYGDPFTAASTALRSMLVAAKGHDLVVADYASIEARIVLWYAGETEALDLFRTGADIYLEMASAIYKYPCNKKEHPHERALGKFAILGCGFGMGWPKFQDTCEKFGMPIKEELAKLAVNTYRTEYAGVPKLWYAQEDAAVKAIQSGKIIECGRVKWGMNGQFLYCKLPSGRCLAYCRPWLTPVMTPWGQEKLQINFWGEKVGKSGGKKWAPQTTYGGKLVENIVQATARDIMANGMMKAHKAGYKVLLTVHDELVTEVPKGFGSVEEMEKLICDIPAWADGCPIAAEGWQGERYKK
jgi:DNA polymerase